jgi:hypothetical protein
MDYALDKMARIHKHEEAEKILKKILPSVASLSFVIGMASGGLKNTINNSTVESPSANSSIDTFNFSAFEYNDPRSNIMFATKAGMIISKSVNNPASS